MLSVLATAGILVLAPGWRDALARWMPRWLAEAVAVPAAAQLACTPVVAGISGQVSLVAVWPTCWWRRWSGPRPCSGWPAGWSALVFDPLGRLLGTGAGWCVGWIATVARTGADLPLPPPRLGHRRARRSACSPRCASGSRCSTRRCCAAGHRCGRCRWRCWPSWSTVPLPTPGWPAAGWVLAMCDVGQGDALVLRAGPGAGVVVDAGPDPAAVDRCLDRLDVERVPLVVLTHFHADHVDGLERRARRPVAWVRSWTTSLLDPPGAVDEVLAEAAAVGVTPTLAASGGAVLRRRHPPAAVAACRASCRGSG